MCLMEPSVLASYTGLGTVRDGRSTFFNSLLAVPFAGGRFRADYFFSGSATMMT